MRPFRGRLDTGLPGVLFVDGRYLSGFELSTDLDKILLRTLRTVSREASYCVANASSGASLRSALAVAEFYHEPQVFAEANFWLPMTTSYAAHWGSRAVTYCNVAEIIALFASAFCLAASKHTVRYTELSVQKLLAGMNIHT